MAVPHHYYKKSQNVIADGLRAVNPAFPLNSPKQINLQYDAEQGVTNIRFDHGVLFASRELREALRVAIGFNLIDAYMMLPRTFNLSADIDYHQTLFMHDVEVNLEDYFVRYSFSHPSKKVNLIPFLAVVDPQEIARIFQSYSDDHLRTGTWYDLS